MKIVLMGASGEDTSALATALGGLFECVGGAEAWSADAAIVVVGAEDGVLPETRRQVELSQQARVPVAAIYIPACDIDEELVELVGLEARELLSKHGAGGDDTPIVRDPQGLASALRAGGR
jgi:translation elongation factor EF-Tu-like GTPase